MYVTAFKSTKFHVLIDNNIATRAIALAQGYDLRESEGQREVYKLSAAVMAFFILGGFSIEPNMAVYTYPKSQDSYLIFLIPQLRYL